MLKISEFSRTDACRLVEAAFADLKREVDDGFAPRSDFPDLEIAQQECFAQERIIGLELGLSAGTYPAQAHRLADVALAERGSSIESLPAARRFDVLHGMTRALIEQQRLYIHRLHDRLLPWQPNDPLFREINCTTASLEAVSAMPTALGPTLASAIDEYLEYGQARWTAKTLKSRKRMLGYLVEHLGTEARLSAITAADIRGFRDAIRRLRSNHHRGHDRSFAGKQTECETKRIAPKTALLIFEPTKAFLAWAKNIEGLIERNPAEAVRIDVPKKVKAQKTRRPFRMDELRTLFSSPVFSGCKSAHRRFEAGAMDVRDAYFWIPILGFYTGARMGELVQLHLGDVHLSAAIPHLTITDEGSGEPGSSTAKHVKSVAGVRDVPLHPDVLSLGFAGFVERRRKLGKSKRLFHEIAFGSDGQASTVFSKWFRRLLSSVGLTDPAVVFHSFRHNAEDALRNALQPQYVIDRIIGHSDGAISSQYGNGVSLEVSAHAVSSMQLPISLRTVIPA